MGMEIKKGSVLRGPFWSEPVEVIYTEDQGNYVLIITKGKNTGGIDNRLIPKDELPKVEVIGGELSFSEETWKVFLALETIRYRYASVYDPLLAVNVSKIDPLPHQIEAVYGYVLKLPRIRFMIADDPGAGKTIMAGLIIKELKLRHLIKRILIVVPGHLRDQWQRELSEKFDEHFEIVDRGRFNSNFGINPWQKYSQIITSMDFAKKKEVLESLEDADFDLVIVDEAHKMSAYRYGNKTEKTDRYKLGEVLSKISNHMLFLTATPHKGDPENFRLLLDLLEPGFFANEEIMREAIQSGNNPLFIRRLKEDLKDFEGRPLFLPRHVNTVPLKLSDREMELYNELSRYVKSQYDKAIKRDRKRNVAFALVILQRRFSSSVYALLESLKRRKKRLEELKSSAYLQRESEEAINFEEVEDMSESERWAEESKWETITLSENMKELEEEIRTVDELIRMAEDILRNEEETKLKELKETLFRLKREFEDFKIIIFTESKDTLEYLNEKVKSWGFSTVIIHGGMNLYERIDAEKRFKNEAEVLIATEAAGEGINLQFCNLMINYDLPWNPNRLEQRMGRIHRYGQQREVHIYNLVAERTREGKVLYNLLEKLNKIREALGSDKVFDVIGEILLNKNLSQLLVEAAVNARDMDEILKEIDIKVDEEYINRIKESLGEALATRHIDLTRIRELAQKAKEERLIPEYTENYFKKAFEKAGGKIRERKDGFLSVESIPLDIRRVAEEEEFKRSFGQLQSKYPKITFDKEKAFRTPDAEFVSFGHPLFEAVMRWVEKHLRDSLLKGAVFFDPDGRLDGYMLFYEGEVRDGTGSIVGKRLFAFYDDGRKVVEVSPAILWDLAEGFTTEKEAVNMEELRKRVEDVVIKGLERYKEELLKERLRQVEIKERYGVKSLEYLIYQLDGEILDLYGKKDKGEDVDKMINRKREKKHEYERGLEELKERLEREKALSLSPPNFLGVIRIKPMRERIGVEGDPEVEAVGMKVAMEYEIREGRRPEDVSSQNLGFDIRSVDRDGRVRYIEVKARAGVGEVALTQNEWFKAQRLKDDYYLYVVFNAVSSPRLIIIQNPAERLKPQEKVDVVRYIVDEREILKYVGGKDEP